MSVPQVRIRYDEQGLLTLVITPDPSKWEFLKSSCDAFVADVCESLVEYNGQPLTPAVESQMRATALTVILCWIADGRVVIP